MTDTAKYTFYTFTFTSREIDQIIDLMKKYSNGSHMVKRAGYTKNVLEYALGWGFLEQRGHRLYIPHSAIVDSRHYLPIEAQWRMVRPMLNEEGSTGYSIVNSKLWSDLNIYPQKSRGASDRDLEAKVDVLLNLCGHHYIHFQMAGSVWSIYPEEEHSEEPDLDRWLPLRQARSWREEVIQ